MSTSSRSDSSCSSSSLDLEELLIIGARCRELRKEKDMLKASHSQSYDLIKQLELHVKRLNNAHSDDKRHIQEVESELRNCCDEIDSLRDQLSSRDEEIDSLGKHVGSLNVQLSNMRSLQDEVLRLTEELNRSKHEVLCLKEEVERKELELKDSTLYIEKLEETISSAALESNCEIESLRLEMLSLEQSALEYKRAEEDFAQEKAVMRELIDQLNVQNEDAHGIIESLEEENNELRYMLDASQTHVDLYVRSVEEHFKMLSENVNSEQKGIEPSSLEVKMCGETLGPLLHKLLALGSLNQDSTEVERMSDQIGEYENLVKRLKEEIKEEKNKAKEESEDLAQEMAELRYQMTELLEEERKRRSCIEQASLQRISELEKQLQIERRKTVASIRQSD